MSALRVVGRAVPRRGLDEKLTGTARYTADLKLPGMLHARVLLSPHPHADVVSVNASAAQAANGVHAILTPFDEESSGLVAVDMKVLDTRVRFVGDEVAVVAAETEEQAEHALELLEVEYRALPFETDAEKALHSDAAAIHPGGNLWGGQPLVLERGDAEAGLREADIVLEETYEVASHSAAPLEPRAALAKWDGDALTVWKTSRGVHQDRAQLATALGILPEKIRVVGPPSGRWLRQQGRESMRRSGGDLVAEGGASRTPGVFSISGVRFGPCASQRSHRIDGRPQAQRRNHGHF